MAESGDASLPDSCFMTLRIGGDVGLPPKDLLGDIIPKPLLRFAAV